MDSQLDSGMLDRMAPPSHWMVSPADAARLLTQPAHAKESNLAKIRGKTSAYGFFVKLLYQQYKRKYPNGQLQDITKLCSQKWKAMNEPEKERFTHMAAQDARRYDDEVNLLTSGTYKVRRKRAKKSKEAPKRALSAFFFFQKDNRPAVFREHPDWNVGRVAQEMARRWREVPQSVKMMYENVSEQDRARYVLQMQEFKSRGVFTPYEYNSNWGGLDGEAEAGAGSSGNLEYGECEEDDDIVECTYDSTLDPTLNGGASSSFAGEQTPDETECPGDVETSGTSMLNELMEEVGAELDAAAASTSRRRSTLAEDLETLADGFHQIVQQNRSLRTAESWPPTPPPSAATSRAPQNRGAPAQTNSLLGSSEDPTFLKEQLQQLDSQLQAKDSYLARLTSENQRLSHRVKQLELALGKVLQRNRTAILMLGSDDAELQLLLATSGGGGFEGNRGLHLTSATSCSPLPAESHVTNGSLTPVKTEPSS